MTLCDDRIYVPLASATPCRPDLGRGSVSHTRARDECSNWQIAVTACDRIGVL